MNLWKDIHRKTRMKFGGFVLFFLVATIFVSLGMVYTNLLVGQMSEAAVSGDLDALAGLIVLVTGVMVLRAAVSAVSVFFMARYSATAGFKLRDYFVKHLLRAPFAKVEGTGSGETLSVYSNDVPMARQFVSDGMLGVIADFVSFASAFVLMIILNPALTGIAIAVSIGMLVLQVILSLPIRWFSIKHSEAKAKFNAVVIDSLQNLVVVAAYNLDRAAEMRYLNAYNHFYAVTRKLLIVISVAAVFMMMVMLLPLIVLFIFLGHAVIDGDMTLAEFVAFVVSAIIAAGGILALAQNMGKLAGLSAGAGRFNSSTYSEFEVQEENSSGSKDAITGTSLAFENVSFSYGDSNTLALDSVSFSVKQGSKVAIIGGSGSGKSTVLKLLLGLFEPSKGTILINGIKADTITKSSLRDYFAFVPQDSFLFPISISQNIALQEDIVDMHRLEKACRDADILDFIMGLPDKFDSVLSESAGNISGGQRQRIALARALYKNAPVILLDEATSSLDEETEASILRCLVNATENKTVIMATHRHAALTFCDTVITLQDGKINPVETEGVSA